MSLDFKWLLCSLGCSFLFLLEKIHTSSRTLSSPSAQRCSEELVQKEWKHLARRRGEIVPKGIE